MPVFHYKIIFITNGKIKWITNKQTSSLFWIADQKNITFGEWYSWCIVMMSNQFLSHVCLKSWVSQLAHIVTKWGRRGRIKLEEEVIPKPLFNGPSFISKHSARWPWKVNVSHFVSGKDWEKERWVIVILIVNILPHAKLRTLFTAHESHTSYMKPREELEAQIGDLPNPSQLIFNAIINSSTSL